MASPQHFHHGDKEIWGECGVGPDTGAGRLFLPEIDQNERLFSLRSPLN
jgi:hypothetical protein